MYALSMARTSPLVSFSGDRRKWSCVAADVNCTSHGTPSLACMVVCTFMPPFFLPVLGFLPTPLKMRLENRVTVVESMILMFLNHGGVFLERLSDKMCTFAHSYLVFLQIQK